MPKVSVICIVFNAMAYLPKTVSSVLAQSFKDFELVIVDDGSSDNVAEWVSTLTDLRIRFVSQANQGIPSARNTGIKHAGGEYIAFLDGDDMWDALKLEQQVKQLDNYPEAGLIYTHTELINEFDRSIGRSVNMNVEGNAMAFILVSNFIGSGSTPMIRKSCFDELGVFYTDPSIAWCDDWEMWVRIATRYNFAIVKQPLTLYRLHTGSASTKYKPVIPLVPAIVERIYESAPPHLLHLKPKTYGTLYLYLALRALEARNYTDTSFLVKQALSYNISLRWLWSGYQIALTMLVKRSSRGVQNLQNKLQRLTEAD